jgi:hypothetical protein
MTAEEAVYWSTGNVDGLERLRNITFNMRLEHQVK